MRRCGIRRVLFTLMLALLVAAGSYLPVHSEEQVKESPAQGHPQMAIDDLNYDAGTVWEGEEVVHTFVIKNKGDAQLDITKVKPG